MESFLLIAHRSHHCNYQQIYGYVKKKEKKKKKLNTYISAYVQ